ncbi:MAG: AAA family ATPase [Spirochaetales bacterium]|nr:AAA family ATPase [Spirochaetales bacterium]
MKKKNENSFSTIIFNQYNLLNVEYENAYFKVWRVKDLHEKKELLLSQFKKKIVSYREQDIIRYKSEMDILAKVDHPNILKIYGVKEYDHLLYTINCTTVGSRLSVHLTRDKTFDLFTILTVIKGISRALSCSHYYNIIHGSIEPDKIWLKINNGNASVIQLSGFGLFPFIDLTTISDSKSILNTVSYLSPEAVGIINSPINRVSDIYSLGVLFYQLCTGRLPFYDDTIEGLVHKHIADSFIPPSQINKDIPPGLDDIISRQLQKDQDKRYQTIEAFLTDMESLEQKVKKEKNKIAKPVELCLNTSFIGRRSEINAIKKCIKETVLPKGRLLLIGGESGSGKTRLIDEFKELIDRNKVCAVFSRCFQGESKTPYSSIHDILEQFNTFHSQLKKDEQQTEKIRLTNCVGHFGQIILQVNDKLSSILGKAEPLIELEPEKENKRFYEVCTEFLCSLGNKERPFILFIDDLQWIDEGSLAILNEIMPVIHKYPFLIVGTYRTEDIADDHIIKKVLINNNIQLLKLENLHYSHLRLLLAELLNSELDDVLGELTGYIMNQGKGNPFFSIELVKHLFAEDIIYKTNSKWELNWTNINIQDIPSSLIDFILKRIKLLSESERDLLSCGAVIGSMFSRELLKSISNKSIEEIEKTLNKAFQLQLIGERMLFSQKIRFSHNKIHDAFNNYIDQTSRKEIHYKIALFYEEKGVKSESDIFLIANHYIKSGNKSRILEFALKAGDLARSKYANEAAINYYGTVKKILEQNNQKGIQAWIKVNEKLIDSYLLTGNSDNAIKIVHNALPHIKSKFSQAVYFCKLTTAFYKKGDYRKCEEYGKTGLKLLGEYLPTSKKAVLIGLLKELFIHIIHSLFSFTMSKKNKNRKYELICQFYSVLNWTYILSDLTKFIRSILRMLNFSEAKIGESKQLAFCYNGYAGLCMAIPFFKRALIYFNKALRLREEIHDEYGIAQTIQSLGFCYELMGMYNKSITYLKQAKHKFSIIGDVTDYGRSLLGLAENYYLLSDYKKALCAVKEYHKIALKSKDNYSLSNSHNQFFKIYLETGNLKEAEINLLKGYYISKRNKVEAVYCLSIIDSGRYYLEQEKTKEALNYLNNIDMLNKVKAIVTHYICYLYNLKAETRITDFHNNTYFQRKKRKKDLRKIKRACRIALKKTKLWATHYGGALRETAKYYGIIHDNVKATQFFIASIEHNEKIGRKFESAKCYFEYGKYLKTYVDDIQANEYLSKAYYIFNATGASGYLQKTEKILDTFSRDISFLEKFKDKIRLASIINLSQKISSILHIESLLDTIIKEAISITGATYGGFYILDEKDNDLKLKASISVRNNSDWSRFIHFREYIARVVFDTGKMIFTRDLSKYKKIDEWHHLAIEKIKSIICLPIKVHKKKIGVFYIDSDQSHSVFNDEDVQLLNVFLSQAAISIENAQLYKGLGEKVEERTLQLQKAMKDLEISNRDLQHFVYIISHDLKEPLRMVSGFLQLLVKRYKDKLDENANEFIAFAVDGANRMTLMIEDLLKYSRVGRQENEIKMVDCNGIVSDVKKNLTILMEERKVKLFVGKLPVVMGYRTLLVQLFQNLIVNAIKFCEAEIPVIHIQFVERDSDWEFQIKDNGISIAEEYQEKIFQIFKRIDRENKYSGTGIGLALCKKIVEQHGGTIWVDSVIGKGSTFHFTIQKIAQ